MRVNLFGSPSNCWSEAEIIDLNLSELSLRSHLIAANISHNDSFYFLFLFIWKDGEFLLPTEEMKIMFGEINRREVYNRGGGESGKFTFCSQWVVVISEVWFPLLDRKSPSGCGEQTVGGVESQDRSWAVKAVQQSDSVNFAISHQSDNPEHGALSRVNLVLMEHQGGVWRYLWHLLHFCINGAYFTHSSISARSEGYPDNSSPTIHLAQFISHNSYPRPIHLA